MERKAQVARMAPSFPFALQGGQHTIQCWPEKTSILRDTHTGRGDSSTRAWSWSLYVTPAKPLKLGSDLIIVKPLHPF